MAPEFRALGVPKQQRGALTDDVLGFLNDAFAHDVVERNGQKFLFLPRPARPQILVGGAPPHALARAAKYGDGWLPIGTKPAGSLTRRTPALFGMGEAGTRDRGDDAASTEDPARVAELRGVPDAGATDCARQPLRGCGGARASRRSRESPALRHAERTRCTSPSLHDQPRRHRRADDARDPAERVRRLACRFLVFGIGMLAGRR
jgi:alkanesulfonate monooxygenase SsuD/methylene tetrahydromethanopterin reductase-like flavin-dependent oxidoreductase (luciferase family)